MSAPGGERPPRREGPDAAARLPSAAPTPVDGPAKTRDLLQVAPKLEVPKGGGAIRGIGEKFQANPVTGSAGVTVPIGVSPGRNGFGPSLALSYDSGSGNGVFGVGWSLSAPTIQRKTDKRLPRYDDTDVFVLSDAEDLVPVGAPAPRTEDEVTYSVQRYRPRVEGSNLRIERWAVSSTDVHWRTWSTSNVRRRWGTTSSARLTNPAVPGKIYAWYLDEERDELGNVVVYAYDDPSTDEPSTAMSDAGREAAGCYLKRILYGNLVPGSTEDGFYFEVVFDYGEHPSDGREAEDPAPRRQDPYSRHRSGFDMRCTRLCRRVLVFHRFDDGADEDAVLTRITSFTYDENPVATTLVSVTHTGVDPDDARLSMPAVSFTYVQPSQASVPAFLEGMEELPNGIDFGRAQWVDLDGEGLAGLLTDVGGLWRYKRNEGAGKLGPWRLLPSHPQPALGSAQLVDIDGDGRLEMVVRTPGTAGFYTRTSDDDWEGFRRFRSGLPLTNGSDRSLDLDGDGLPDVLTATATGLVWYQAKGAEGWGLGGQGPVPHDEDTGPAALYQTDRDAVFLVDVDGDGLTDVVRVRNGSICYWPNLGHGRFGARVQMAGAPRFDTPDRFDPKRVRFADIDGSGPADLVYLGPTKVHWWPNQAGNGFGDAQTIDVPVEDPITVSFADIRGDGTQCLVWASPLGRDRLAPLRYVRLMQDGKPYLMRTLANGLGRTTTFTYTPSTTFYLADRRALTPWATRLPFPVQCLSEVEVLDEVTGWRLVTTYAYHHGYFDGVEREFRGFGRVDQRDAESVGTGEDELDQPPVVTKTWFHTGAWQDEATLENVFATEWWDGDTVVLEDTVMPADLTPGRTREAHRALKGQPLRVEVYAEDGSELADVPYAVTRSTYTVVAVVDDDDATYGVFRADPRETASEHVERGDDTRVGHELVLEVDDYGAVLKKASVAYGRATGDDPQTTSVIQISTSTVVHDTAEDARWHVAVPTRSQSFHLVGLEVGSSTPATISALIDAFDEADRVEWAADPGASELYLRQCADRVISYADGAGDETFTDADWTLGDRVLVFQTYAKAFAPDQVTDAAAFDDRIDGTDLVAAGYVDLAARLVGLSLTLEDAPTGWWAPSGTPTRDDAHFFVTTAVTDAFGNDTTVDWHPTFLFPETVTDALGNAISAEIDLHYLAPKAVTDPNGNATAVAFDALGQVVKMAQIGADDEGDTLDHPTATYAVELDRWVEDGEPVRIFTRQRETHVSDLGMADPETGTRWLERYDYSDGAGNVIHSKLMAAPDPETDDPRWIGTGKIVLDNKGNVIKAYEPFFSDNADYEFESDLAVSGVASTVKYDPLGRAMQVDLPNGTRRRVSFTPWSSTTWDENDCSGDADLTGDSALLDRAEDHRDTPATVHLDAQGRVYKTDELIEPLTAFTTELTLDVVGNPTVVTDAIGVDTQTQAFDLLGRPIRTDSPDAGFTVALLDVVGQPVLTWRSGSLSTRQTFDALRRRTHLYATEGVTERLKELNLYGERTGVPGVGYFKGRLYRQYDTAGVVTNTSFDFKGNLLGTARRYWGDVDDELDWSDLTSADVDDIADDADPLLEADTSDLVYTTSRTFDAMNRVVTETTPDAAVTTNAYDDGGALVSVATLVHAASIDAVTSIEYNARGQRDAIAYGSGVTTTHTYDPATFRLTRLLSTRSSDDAVMQDLRYTYDPVGNVTLIENEAHDTLYFDNMAVSPDQSFVYDALYRLVEGTGRERTAATEPTGSNDDVDYDGSGVPDDSEIAAYTEQYSYDAVGNVREMVHRQGGPSGTVAWRRRYRYEGEGTGSWPPSDTRVSNRLAYTTLPGSTSTWLAYVHDDRGSMVRMPHLRASVDNLVPDFRDQVKRALLATSGQDALYFYDSGGQRVRKVVRVGNNEERRYVGRWELWTSTASSGQARETLHVMDGEQRIAMVETKTVTGGSPVTPLVPVIRYQLGNHLGSSVLELDEDGALISYEEYHPNGSTALWAQNSGTEVSRKRYRYTGMEKDEETGLSRHGVRMYATWLGRWTSADPSTTKDGPNLYAYCHANPSRLIDQTGRGGDDYGEEARKVVEVIKSGQQTPIAGSVQDQVETGPTSVVRYLGVSELALSLRFALSQYGIGALALAADLAPPVGAVAVTGVVFEAIAEPVAEADYAVRNSPWAQLKYSGAPIVFQEVFLQMQSEGATDADLRSFVDTHLAMTALEQDEVAQRIVRARRTEADDMVVSVGKSDSKVLRALRGIPWGQYKLAGCEDVATSIHDAIGGEVKRFAHKEIPGFARGATLGPRGKQDTEWYFHEVVVKDGKVYDAMTGPEGQPIDDYKKEWEYRNDIDFGF
jgi:RHS repeat-associated protein